MVDRVIIVDTKRGNSDIPGSELFQMAGRCSRDHKGSVGHVDILTGNTEVQDVKEELGTAGSHHVESQLGGNEALCFHIVAEIASGVVRSTDDAKRWYAKSLSHAQGIKVDFDEVFDELFHLDAVFQEGDEVMATEIGLLSSKYYYAPQDVFWWKENFDTVFRRGRENDDVSLTWALANTPCGKRQFDINRIRNVAYELYDLLSCVGLSLEEGSVFQAVLWQAVLGGRRPTKLGGEIALLKRDFGRLHRVLLGLDEYAEWEMREFFERLKVRADFGVPDELVDLCSVNSITKRDAQEMYHVGIARITDFIENPDLLDSLSDALRHKLEFLRLCGSLNETNDIPN